MKLLVLFSFIIIIVSCIPAPDSGEISIATYNAYCLFDSVGDGDEFTGFRKSDGYSEAVYDERIRNLAILLGRYVDADVIILEEVESEIVLSDLIEAGLRKKGYFYYGLATTGEEAISVGFLSRIEPNAVRMHSFGSERPILEISLTKAGERFSIFGVHLRSKLEESSRDIRYGQLRHLSSLIEARSDSFVIVAGDFNADPREEGEALSEYPESYSESTALSVSADPGRVNADVLYAPLLDEETVQKAAGTYFFDGSWLIYDSILSTEDSVDGIGFELCAIEIISRFEMLDILGRPLAFDPSTGNGFSDHLPVVATFRKTG